MGCVILQPAGQSQNWPLPAGYSDRSMYRLLRKTYRSLNADTRSEAIVEALRLGLL